MAEDVGLDLLRVDDAEAGDVVIADRLEHTLVANLTARLRVERRRVEHDDSALAGIQSLDRSALVIERDDLGVLHQRRVPGETRLVPDVVAAGRPPAVAGPACRVGAG